MGKLYSDMSNIREGMLLKTCTNKVCVALYTPPIILMGKVCWNCNSADYLHTIERGDNTID